jgi:hypothetical protein
MPIDSTIGIAVGKYEAKQMINYNVLTAIPEFMTLVMVLCFCGKRVAYH